MHLACDAMVATRRYGFIAACSTSPSLLPWQVMQDCKVEKILVHSYEKRGHAYVGLKPRGSFGRLTLCFKFCMQRDATVSEIHAR